MTKQANATVTVGSQPVLEVTANQLLGTSADNVSPDKLTDDQLKRVATVFPFNGEPVTWTVGARDLQFNGAAPGTVTVTLKSAVSQASRTLVLNATTPSGTSFSNDTTLDTTLILPNAQLQVSGNTVSTTFSAVDVFRPDGGAAVLFSNLLTNVTTLPTMAGNVASYNPARASLGRLSGESMKDDVARAIPSNVRDFGFEAVTVTLDSANNPGLSKPLKATVKVRHPSSLAYITAHGSHEGLLFLQPEIGTTTNTLLGPDQLASSDVASLQTLFLDSCNALDMHDYNNNYVGDLAGRTSPTDPLSARESPGQKWWKATGNGRVVLLGHNFPLEGFSAYLGLIKYFQKGLPTLAGRPEVPSDQVQQRAWLAANRVIGSNSSNSQALSACAWDKTTYYYIAYTPPLKHHDKDSHDFKGYFTIPLDSNGDNQSIKPGVVPPNGAKRITIPDIP